MPGAYLPSYQGVRLLGEAQGIPVLSLSPTHKKEPTMGIGVGIFLIAVGAVLAFAVDAAVNGIDLQTVGVILMIVGALGLVLDLVIFAPRRRRVVDVVDDAPTRSRVVERETY
jgi:hypothetical protein